MIRIRTHWVVAASLLLTVPAWAQAQQPTPRTPEVGGQTTPKGGPPQVGPGGQDQVAPPHGEDPSRRRAASAPNAFKKPDTPEQRAKLLDDLYAHLAAAEDERAANEVMQSIARVWLNSGSDTVDALTQRALKAVQAKKFDLAKRLLDTVVEIAPDYAEGWSNRGHVYYLNNDVELALGDLRRALALDPNHFKALDGLGTILREIGQKKAALKTYEKLLNVHPFWSGAKQAVDDLKKEVDGQGI
jgi:tetratricopeptide (TPR) repeat protein